MRDGLWTCFVDIFVALVRETATCVLRCSCRNACTVMVFREYACIDPWNNDLARFFVDAERLVLWQTRAESVLD